MPFCFIYTLLLSIFVSFLQFLLHVFSQEMNWFLLHILKAYTSDTGEQILNLNNNNESEYGYSHIWCNGSFSKISAS